jgi:DNA repair exonuclease SbcCD ATPase subunit
VKRLIVTDTHLGMYSDADAWLDIVLSFYKHIVLYCVKNKITQLIHLGDFFDNRKSLNTKTQHTAHRIAKVLSISKDLHTYIIVGNHDCYYKNQIHPNTLELFKEYNHITVIDEITKLDDILLTPWGEVPESTQGAKYCFGHFAINGFHMNDSYRCKDGLDKVKLKDFEKVLSGHFHTPSSNHNITYLGAPYGQTFHDAGGIRGYHIFEDGKLTFIEYTDAPKFMKIYSGNDFGDDIKGNIVRLIFEKDYGTTKNQEIIDSLIKKEPFLYSINFTSMDSDDTESDSESIEMESKEKIVDQFIDSQAFSTNIKIPTLKAMFKKLMKETGESKTNIKTADGTKIECIEVGFQNFLSFGSKWQEVPLYNGVNFVTGIDKDKDKSNGAGKSSFLETIPFALFGKTARDIKQDQIVNWKNKKNCQVVFRFKINEDIYEINRQLKPNKLEIFKNGNLMDQDAHKSDYQSMFEDIFGMNVKMFMSLIHSNVNSSSSNIMNMKKAEKRLFLERMFGLEIYSDMNKLCNDKLREVENKKYKIDTDISTADDKTESALQLQLQFNKEIQSKNSILDDVNEIQEKVDKLKEDTPNLDSDIEALDKEIKNKREDFHKITLEFETWKAKLDSEIEHLKKDIEQIEDQEEQRKKNLELKEKIEAIEKKAGKINEIQDNIEKLKLQESETSEKYDNKFIEVSDIEKELIELKTNLKNVDKNLELLSKGICPVCGQDVTDPQTHYKKEQESINKNISVKNKKLSSLKKEKEDFLTELSEIRKKESVLDKTKDTLYRLENQLKEVGSEEKKDELIKDRESKIDEIKKALTLYNKKEKKHSNEIEALKNKHTDMCSEQSIIKSKEKELDLLKSQAKEAKKHIESLETMIKKQDEIIELAKSKKKIAESNKIRLNDISDYLNSIKVILKDENIKQFTIKQIMPFMNKQTNHYLSEVNYGFYVNIDKWLDVDIKGPGIRNASYESLSGGERRGVDIAIQLSLLDIARTQAGIFPDLLVFDELLDSSIDSRGINELMKIVRFKQKEFGGKVFIISHRDEIDNEMVDHQYHVVKENGYSKVNI